MKPLYVTSFVKTKLKMMLRCEGNYLNNIQTLKDGRGKLIVARNTSTKFEVSVNTFVPKVIDWLKSGMKKSIFSLFVIILFTSSKLG